MMTVCSFFSSPVEKRFTSAGVPCVAAPSQSLFSLMACWQTAVLLLVLPLGPGDECLFEKKASTSTSAFDEKQGQIDGRIRDGKGVWVASLLGCPIAIVPAAGVKLQEVRRRQVAPTLHGEALWVSTDSGDSSGLPRHVQRLSDDLLTEPLGNTISVVNAGGTLPRGWTSAAQFGRPVAVFATQASPEPGRYIRSKDTLAVELLETVKSPEDLPALLSLGAETVVVQPQTDMWICRLSYPDGPCGSRSWQKIPAERSCISTECCSKTYCAKLGLCGEWCINNHFLCLIKNSDYSNGHCSCANYRHQCDPEADCRDMPESYGGAFCECREGLHGNGRICKTDPCHANPCSPGDCRRAADGSLAYTCSCPVNYEVKNTAEGQSVCKPKANVCLPEPCGPNALDCLSFDDEYECICDDGFIYKQTKCEQVDWCAENPCGSPAAVHACVSNLLDYTCFCREGYAVVTDPYGKQVCRKNPCTDNPCGPPELAESCNVISDEEGNVAGYTCVCTDIATLQHTTTPEKPVCEIRDLCRDDPCGSQEVVRGCYVEGYSYYCECQPGYSPQIRKGRTRCVPGDPCLVGACGDPFLVEECMTDGKAYTCTCVAGKAFLSFKSHAGIEYCEDLSICQKWCGDVLGLESCLQDEEGNVDCKCKPGFTRAFAQGQFSCVEGDVCSTRPCGTLEATNQCIVDDEDTYRCICNKGFEVRHLSESNAEVCAALNSCIGNPCGDPDAVVECVEGDTTYDCICEQEYLFEKRGPTGGMCVPESSSPTVFDEPDDSPHKETKTEASGLSLWTLTACAGAGVLLLLLVGSGVIFKKSSTNEDSLPAAVYSQPGLGSSYAEVGRESSLWGR